MMLFLWLIGFFFTLGFLPFPIRRDRRDPPVLFTLGVMLCLWPIMLGEELRSVMSRYDP